jgi:hypothetical protein
MIAYIENVCTMHTHVHLLYGRYVFLWSWIVFVIHGPTLSEVKSAMHVLTNVYSATHPHFVHVSSLNPNSTVREFGPKLKNGLSSSTMMQIKMTQIVHVHAAMSMASTRLSSKI